MDAYEAFAKDLNTPVSQPVDSRQVVNSTGGFVHVVDHWTRYKRFLSLGSAGGSYYIGEKNLTEENYECVMKCLLESPERALALLEDTVYNFKAAKLDAPVFVATLIAVNRFLHDGSATAQAEANQLQSTMHIRLAKLLKTPTMFFMFTRYYTEFRGWSRWLRKLARTWYDVRSVSSLDYLTNKYNDRQTWTHRDMLRCAHPRISEDFNRALMYGHLAQKIDAKDLPFAEEFRLTHLKRELHAINKDALSDKLALAIADVLIEKQAPWEIVPTEFLNNPAILSALIRTMEPQALVRMANRATIAGVQDAFCNRIYAIINEGKKKIHPYNVLVALKTYAAGVGFKGTLKWTPQRQTIDALELLLSYCFRMTVSTKKVMVAMDISGSTTSYSIAKSPLTVREGIAAMTTAHNWQYPHCDIGAFDVGFDRVNARPNGEPLSFNGLMQATNAWGGGATDCSLPLLTALVAKKYYDAFIIYTDNEVNRGYHVPKVLAEYRTKINPRAKLIVCAMIANNFTINDPADVYGMDIAGFDGTVPTAIANFIEDE